MALGRNYHNAQWCFSGVLCPECEWSIARFTEVKVKDWTLVVHGTWPYFALDTVATVYTEMVIKSKTTFYDLRYYTTIVCVCVLCNFVPISAHLHTHTLVLLLCSALPSHLGSVKCPIHKLFEYFFDDFQSSHFKVRRAQWESGQVVRELCDDLSSMYDQRGHCVGPSCVLMMQHRISALHVQATCRLTLRQMGSDESNFIQVNGLN